jgi:mannose-1-phosphate guanylyltransferase/phosphomannomutase
MGKYSNFTKAKLKEYALIATIDGNFAFSEFSVTRDAMYAGLKIMELISCHNVKLSEVVKDVEAFDYRQVKVDCAQRLKGKMMRKFLEDAKDKKSSTVDGVKIWESDKEWVLMIPDQYSEHLNPYIQASTKEAGDKLYERYIQKISSWSNED